MRGTVRGSLEGHGQQAERRWGEDRSERSLEGSGADEHPERLGHTADGRGHGKSDQAADQRPLAAEQIAELAPEQQEAAERQRVGGDDPLPVVGGEVKCPLGRRERDVHDRRVQHDHELGDAQEREDRPSAGAGSEVGVRAGGAHQIPSKSE
jgi:hypothetical protein